MSTIKMLVGLPASGKSTYTKQQEGNYFVLNADTIRRKNPSWDNDKVFNHLYKLMYDYMDEKYDIILDNTNITVKDRSKFFQKFNNHSASSSYDVEAYILNIPFEKCLSRNAQRDRREKVPPDTIFRYYSHFQIPFYEEGFSEIFLAKRKSLSSKKRIEALNLMDVNQDNPYHNQTILYHCLFTGKMMQFMGVYDKVLMETAIFHDYGKIKTKSYDKYGVAHYFNHENIGAYELMCQTEIFGFDSPPIWDFRNKNKDLLIETLFYINNHMFFNNTNMKEKTLKKYQKLWGTEKFNNLKSFNVYDKMR